MTDLVTFGETMLRLSPPGNERLETADRLGVHAGGAESNAAIAAGRLGVNATWVSKLPNTPLGDRIVNELRQQGIDTDVVRSEEGRLGTYYLEHAGVPRGVNVHYDRADAAITTATADELPVKQIREAAGFLTSGITPALSEQLVETTADLLRIAKESGSRTALDVNYRSKLWSPDRASTILSQLFPAVDVLVTPIRDARNVFGIEGDAAEIAHHFASAHEFATVVVTRGEHGALALNDGVIHEQPAFECDTVDPIGTGDAFTGAFLARRMQGDDVGTALEYGAATAALKRTIPGDAATVSRAEVERVVGSDGRTISR